MEEEKTNLQTVDRDEEIISKKEVEIEGIPVILILRKTIDRYEDGEIRTRYKVSSRIKFNMMKPYELRTIAFEKTIKEHEEWKKKK